MMSVPAQDAGSSRSARGNAQEQGEAGVDLQGLTGGVHLREHGRRAGRGGLQAQVPQALEAPIPGLKAEPLMVLP
jgi:hypothetical protein